MRYGNNKKMAQGHHLMPQGDRQLKARSTGGLNVYRTALLSACDRMEKSKEFAAQHGAIRVIMKDGKRVDE